MSLDTSINNSPPSTHSNTFNLNEDTSYIFTAIDFNFSDSDANDTLQAVRFTSMPTDGQLKLNGVAVSLNQTISISDINAGKLSFIPDANENGTNYSHFNFQVNDGALWSTDATFTMNVAPINDIPVANPDVATGDEDNPITINVLANDTDADGDHLFISDYDSGPLNAYGTFSDVDEGDVLTYSVQLAGGSDLPSWLHYDAATRTLSGTPDDPDVGTIDIRVIATDSQNARVSDDFNLTVNAVPDPLFTPNNDIVDFNNIDGNSYLPGTQYNADAGDDEVTLPSSAAAAALANYDPSQFFSAGSGNDIISMGGLALSVNTEEGNDIVKLTSLPQTGLSTIFGGSDIDQLDLSALSHGVQLTATILGTGTEAGRINDFVHSDSVLYIGFEQITGTGFNDYFIDNSRSNNFFMGVGDDTVQVGGLGGPTTFDNYYAGLGTDTLDLSSLVIGMQVKFNANSGASGELSSTLQPEVALAALTDFENIIGTQFNDSFGDNEASHTMLMQGSDDTLHVIALNNIGLVNDIYDGGSGVDTLDLSTVNEGISISYNPNAAALSTVANPTNLQASVLRFENITGTQYDDVINGNNSDNALLGNGGDDILAGYDGNDNITGNAGNDSIDGGAGTDTAHYSGLKGNYSYSGNANGNLIVTDNPGSEGTDFMTSIELISFQDGTIDVSTLILDQQTHSF